MSIAADDQRNTESRLDQWGMGAWIALMVLGFFIWWPLGLATLAYSYGAEKWAVGDEADVGRYGRDAMRDRPTGCGSRRRAAIMPSTSTARETLRRLEEEQREFKEFLERLRFAKDKTEFDQFMAERRSRATPTPQTQS